MKPRIYELRTSHKPPLTQEALAHRAGLSLRSVQNIEIGRTDPQLATAHKLARALGVTLLDLFDDTAA